MSQEALPKWSDEVVADAFREEIRTRFEAHNAAYRAREAVELEDVLRDNPDKRGQPGYEVRDSGAWEVYQASEIRIDRNAVMIVLPRGTAVSIDLIHLFDHTTMSWSRASVGALIVDGEARSTIEIVLVATWTDEMDAAWKNDGNDRKRFLVELYETDVLALDALVCTHCLPNDATAALRSRLKLALEHLP